LDAVISDLLTLGCEPSLLLRIEKVAWSPDAKCVLCDLHMPQSSRLAHAPVKKIIPTISVIRVIRERIERLLFS
jgi:hypothetical protein